MEKLLLKLYSAPEIVPQDVVKFLKKRKYNKAKKLSLASNDYRIEQCPTINEFGDLSSLNTSLRTGYVI